ncbi:exonuclease VIII [Escherichia coli]|uniref:Exonuclease VIII n=1 Tax=Escherichia coli TaxID=562 RepID=A0A377E5E2_ECOLX|nr:exonuclease VIII [Escherichia coli]
MSTKPLFLLRKAKKSSSEPDVVLWASNDFESTCATLDYLIVKSGKKLSSYLKLLPRIFLSLMTCPLKVRSILPGVNAINSAKTP